MHVPLEGRDVYAKASVLIPGLFFSKAADGIITKAWFVDQIRHQASHQASRQSGSLAGGQCGTGTGACRAPKHDIIGIRIGWVNV